MGRRTPNVLLLGLFQQRAKVELKKSPATVGVNLIMNREIKFRAWDKFNGQYWFSKDYKNLAEFFKAMQYLIDGGNDLIFQQFTGLHDKNGKEVYEGDVVKKYKQINQLLRGDYVNKGFCYYEVCFERGKFLLKYISCDDSLKNYFGENKIFGKQTDDLTNCEFVGTIHENPELLKK